MLIFTGSIETNPPMQYNYLIFFGNLDLHAGVAPAGFLASVPESSYRSTLPISFAV
jgi:hypothetical protein